MRFQVPQYIEVEDKIFGPLTFKQFVYLAGAAGLCAVLFTLLPKFIAIILSLPVAGLGLALAFFKVNERPFALIIEDFFKYYVGGRLYIWKRSEETKGKADDPAGKPYDQVYVPKLSQSKLRDLTFELDVKNQSNPITKDQTKDTV
ncbi:PrgI family protein [Candidatus Parcubacteria bacterium]|nr:PrgI family protein [Candidatus Parcubacteria bacterium]